MMRNPITWRSSHVRHHTDTIIVGRDPEIVAMRPPDLGRIILNFFGIDKVEVLCHMIAQLVAFRDEFLSSVLEANQIL